MGKRAKRAVIVCLSIFLISLGFAIPSQAAEDSSAITVLEIRKKTLDGEVVADILHPSGDWALDAGEDYYIYCEMKKTAGNSYVGIKTGNTDDTCNGLTFFNPPGGTYTPKAIEHSYFDSLAAFQTIDDPTYGVPEKKLTMQDGTMIYHIKDDISSGETMIFAMGLVVQDASFSGETFLADAASVAIGDYAGGTFTPVFSKTFDVNMNPKSELVSAFNGTLTNGTLDKNGNNLTFYVKEKSTSEPVALIYDKLEMDVSYPLNAELGDIGFNGSFVKTHANYGTLTVGKTVIQDGVQKTHITITGGYKPASTNMTLYYNVNFKSKYFADGQKCKTTMENLAFYMPGGVVKNVTEPATPVTYTLIDPLKDSVTMSAVNRAEIYNQSIGTGEAYLVNFGSAYIKNGSNDPAPREKTYEAEFNTTGTAANISVITVPMGSNTAPQVAWTGKDASGRTLSGTIANPGLYCNAKNNPAGSVYMQLNAEDFGIVTFTSVKADIGKIKGGYVSSGWTSSWEIGNNRAGAFGYFTTTETGIQVKNVFRLYNTDPAYRDAANGDLTVTSVGTSSTNPKIGWNSPGITVRNSSGAVVDSVPAGDTVKVTGTFYPYSVPGAVKSGSVAGSMTAVVDPVIYLTLPQGITLDETKLKFKLIKKNFQGTGSTNEVGYSLENISYKNKTGDGTSIFKVSFPEGTQIGYYDAHGYFVTVSYEIGLVTSKSLQTKRYFLSDMVGLSAEIPVQTFGYVGNPTSLNKVIPDTYGINGGLAYAGIGKTTEIGFGVQQLAEINIYNSVSVSRVNGVSVAEDWFAYDRSDPNSIAMLGRSSEGRFRMHISNTSDAAASGLKIAVPIPEAAGTQGSALVESAGFDMSMTYDAGEYAAKGFTISYARLNKAYSQAEEIKASDYTVLPSADGANVIVIACDEVPARAEYDFYLDFTVENGEAGSTNIWRNIYNYANSDGSVYSKQGSTVASSIAGSSVSGTVFEDANRDGVRGAEEAGIEGVTVVVKDEKGRIISQTTDALGFYEFLAVRESELEMTFTLDAEQPYRFNVPAAEADSGSAVSTVVPAEDGLSAVRTFTAAGQAETVYAAAAAFHTLTYDKNNTSASGNVPEVGEYIKGSEAIISVKPDNLLLKGYEFKEWNTKKDGTGQTYLPGQSLTVNEDITLYAIWEIGTYKITFNYRGAEKGNEITEKTLVYNTAYNADGVSLPKPEKMGYSFGGWCLTATGTSAVKETAKFNTGEDTVLYAVWKPKTGYTVHYETLSEESIIADKSAAWNDLVTGESPVRTGYTFEGWSCWEKMVAAGAVFSDLAESDTAGTEITLTAVWAAKSGYSVTYDTAGGSEITGRANVKWSDSGLLPAVNPEKTGYAFDGWKIGDNTVDRADTYGKLTVYQAGAADDGMMSVELTAQWKESTGKTVRYNTGGGTGYSDLTNVSAGSDGLTPAVDPVKAGYLFAGWSYKGIAVDENTRFEEISAEDVIVLTADWTEKQYTVIYDADGTASITSYWTGSGLVPAETPVRTGYTFEGWHYGTVRVENSTTVADLIPADNAVGDTIALKAKWEELGGYVIVYESGEGATRFSSKSGVKYTTAGLLPDTNPVRTGYTFDGWMCNGKTVGRTTACSELISGESKTVTLTAQWSVKGGYTVSYDSNGGTGELSGKTDVLWTDSGLLPAETLSKKGYLFSGWNYGRTTVTEEMSYGEIAAGDTASGITLVAQWTLDTGYVVNYDTGEGRQISPKTGVSWTTRNLIPLQNVTLAGYELAGWTYNGVMITAASTYGELAGTTDTRSITLSAKFIPTDMTDSITGGNATDVQGKIVEDLGTPVYKIDIKWGDMKFNWTESRSWNPDTHSYDGDELNVWLPESFFENGNNEIRTANHSNADVEVNYTAASLMDGVSIRVKQTNRAEGEDAAGMFLGKVPAQKEDAPEISAYVWLAGTPTDLEALRKDNYQKIANIVVTIKPVTGSEMTPMK